MDEAAAGLPGLLVCQETLQPLTVVDGGLWSQDVQRLYPVRGGLVYMGYPERDRSLIASTMAEEHDWQGTVRTVERDAEFLTVSAPRAVRFINLLAAHAPAPARVLELGSGSGWVSWLLAEAGYDTYLCDFEANSLTLGLEFTHPRMGLGRRIVGDARYAPFPSGSFDLVVFKEFVHHVEDFATLFREANRLLRPQGFLAMLEPTMSVVKRIYQMRYPDPHAGHRITWPERYLRSLAKLGFTIAYVGAEYDERLPDNSLLRAAQRDARRRVADDPRLAVLGRVYLSLIGGAQLVALAQKQRSLAPIPRPSMTIIDSATMTTTTDDRAIYAQLRPIVEHAASALGQTNH